MTFTVPEITLAPAVISLIVGLVSLLFGRALYWLFVGLAGLLLGLQIGAILMPESSDLIRLLVMVGLGVLFAVLAILFQKPMAAIGGFLGVWSGVWTNATGVLPNAE